MPKKGYTQTKEHKEGLRQVGIGRKHSIKTKKLMSESHLALVKE